MKSKRWIDRNLLRIVVMVTSRLDVTITTRTAWCTTRTARCEDGHVPELLDCSDLLERPGHVEAAITALRRGRVAVVPAESSYVLACDAFSVAAVSRVREMKGRSNSPLAVLVGSPATADGIATGIPRYARDLMSAFWPGMLSLVMRQQPSLAWPLTARKIAVRMPLHPILLELADRLGPIAVTTANSAGMPVAMLAGDAESAFESEASVYLDAGPAADMGRSTIVDVTSPDAVLVREGSVTAQQIRDVCLTLEVSDVT
jgi:L-threonylcarbamoyladenylate synthase